MPLSARIDPSRMLANRSETVRFIRSEITSVSAFLPTNVFPFGKRSFPKWAKTPAQEGAAMPLRRSRFATWALLL